MSNGNPKLEYRLPHGMKPENVMRDYENLFKHVGFFIYFLFICLCIVCICLLIVVVYSHLNWKHWIRRYWHVFCLQLLMSSVGIDCLPLLTPILQLLVLWVGCIIETNKTYFLKTNKNIFQLQDDPTNGNRQLGHVGKYLISLTYLSIYSSIFHWKGSKRSHCLQLQRPGNNPLKPSNSTFNLFRPS